MNQTIETPQTAQRCSVARRVQVGAATVAAAVLVPVGVTMASPPTAEEEAGAVVEGLGTDGASFVATYGLPALGVALGIALIWGITRRVGKRVIGSF